jgi:hypothetical protein
MLENEQQVAGTLTIDLSKALNMQTLTQTVQAIPVTTGTTVVGIAIPLLGINCNDTGIISIVDDLKEAMSRLYNYCMTSYVQPVWEALYQIFNFLKNLGLAALDLTIPVLNLHISDLFAPDLYNRIKASIIHMYYNARDQLYSLLDTLGIKYPFFSSISCPQWDIEQIVKSIFYSLWSFVVRKIFEIIGIIKTGWALYDAAFNNNIPTWSTIWENLKTTFLVTILQYLAAPPSFQDIYDALIAYAKLIYNKVVVTAQDLLKALESFTLPLFGKPFDWLFPWNPTTNIPEVDVIRIINDIAVWTKNFIFNIVTKFVQAVAEAFKALLSLVGLSFPVISIPITLCVVPVSGQTTTPKVPIP